MGNTAPLPTDLLYVNEVDGTPLSSTTVTNIEPNTATNPSPAVPLGYFQMPYGQGKSFHWIASGVVSTAAATPGTLTLALAIGTTPTVLVSTPAITPAVSLANGEWIMSGDTIVRSVGTAGIFESFGTFKLPSAAAATSDMTEVQMPANTAAASWGVAYDTTQIAAGAYALHVRATWSTAAAGDTITCTNFLVAFWN